MTIASVLRPSTPKARLSRDGRPGLVHSNRTKCGPVVPALRPSISLAGVVPAVGYAVFVRVGLQVVDRGRPGPLDQLLLRGDDWEPRLRISPGQHDQGRTAIIPDDVSNSPRQLLGVRPAMTSESVPFSPVRSITYFFGASSLASLTPAASRWSRPVIGTNSVGLSSDRSIYRLS